MKMRASLFVAGLCVTTMSTADRASAEWQPATGGPGPEHWSEYCNNIGFMNGFTVRSDGNFINALKVDCQDGTNTSFHGGTAGSTVNLTCTSFLRGYRTWFGDFTNALQAECYSSLLGFTYSGWAGAQGAGNFQDIHCDTSNEFVQVVYYETGDLVNRIQIFCAHR